MTQRSPATCSSKLSWVLNHAHQVQSPEKSQVGFVYTMYPSSSFSGLGSGEGPLFIYMYQPRCAPATIRPRTSIATLSSFTVANCTINETFEVVPVSVGALFAMPGGGYV
jgi:hypothetical protein